MSKLKRLVGLFYEIWNLPGLLIFLDKSEEGLRIFKYFTSRHPKFFIFKAKSIGVAIIEKNKFKTGDSYIDSVSGKNSAAYFSRRAAREGYSFRKIDLNKFSDQVLLINTSATSRQGREMDDSYKIEAFEYPVNDHNLYYGVFKDNTLTAYIWCVRSGELVLLNRLLGHSDHLNKGVMYLLLTSTVCEAVNNMPEAKYIMYDTFFGAGEGLKMFKKRIGFKAYKVKWKIK